MTREHIIRRMREELSQQISMSDSQKELLESYLNMALDIGQFHFHVNSEEIVSIDMNGMITGRYKDITEASRITGTPITGISQVLRGRRHTSGNRHWKYASM